MTPTLLPNASESRLSDSISPDIVQFLETTAWGCQGLQYYVKNYDHALQRLPNPHFYSVMRSGQLVGNVMFFMKPVSTGTREIRIAYLTQLAVRPENRGQGLAGQLVDRVVRHVGALTQEPTGVTAYIEEANAPSLAVFRKQGFEDVATFHGIVINRLHPQPCLRAKTLPEKDRTTLWNLLTELYTDHALQDFSTSVKAKEYRVIYDEEGRILAGLQGHLEQWQVTQMEGIGGMLVVNVLSKSRWFREHLFNPAESHFVHIGNMYARPGHENLLYLLIEDLLAAHHVPFAVIYFDKRSPVYQRFAAAGSFGILNSQMETPVRIMARFTGIHDDEISEMKRRPLVISPLDIS